MDPISKFAQNIIKHSCRVVAGENVMVQAEGISAKPLVLALVDEIYALGAFPFVDLIDTDIQNRILKQCQASQMEIHGLNALAKIRQMDALIVISALENPYQYQDVPLANMSLYNQHFMERCFYGYAVTETKWLYVKYPTNAMAQLMGMNLAAFEQYYFDVCNLDYRSLSTAMDPLVSRMQQADQVRITGPGTNLTFSIKDIPTLKSDGLTGLPDGEVFTAPQRKSVNGVIQFNCPLHFRGTLFENIRFEVRDGLIEKATCNHTERLNQILDTDAGSRYFGEFAFGLNPKIVRPMKDILFDEKMAGSIHMAVGNSYVMADNGNHSLIHMDIVCQQTPEFGGGEVYLDDVLVRKDGLFVEPGLQGLNELTMLTQR